MALSCNSQVKSNAQNRTEIPAANQLPNPSSAQIAEYLVDIFEDSKGNLWFGTMQKGLAKYDGKKLTYYTMEDGLGDNAAVTVIEDKQGHLWIGTHAGLSKFDGKELTHYTEEDGLCHNRVSCLLIDQTGILWIGTWGGVCKFDGNRFTNFPIPNPDIELPPNPDTMDWVTEVMQDSKGNMWFGRDGWGACQYDGQSFTHFTKKEGLPSNAVQDILDDKDGNIWFASRVAEKDHFDPQKRMGPGGLTKYDGTEFTNFPNLKGLSRSDVYGLYLDDEGILWVSATTEGLYRYDGLEFTNIKIRNGEEEASKVVQGMLKDSKGNLWLGCNGGLYRMNANGLVNVTIEGPWE